MESEIVQKAVEEVKKIFSKKVNPAFSYHNIEHTLKAYNASLELSEKALLADVEKEILLLAALFHDVGFVEGPDNHEQRSAEISSKWLKSQGYQEAAIAIIDSMILATKKDAIPVERLAKLLKDADLAGLAKTDYMMFSKKLHEEWEFNKKEKISDFDFHKMNFDFMKVHKYFSPEGKKLYNKGKKANMKVLKKNLKEKVLKELTISESKSAQTQFKTALRNHIDLSAIADNKANIMLSVNALIITVAMPIIASQVMENHKLVVPALILLSVCVISMVYATLATRPIKMMGKISIKEIEAGKSNLFFFGNFHKMTLEEYEVGIKHVISDSAKLDASITRDLYFLGRSLGSKYSYLRICYNVFMFGIVIAVLAFAIAFFLSNQS